MGDVPSIVAARQELPISLQKFAAMTGLDRTWLTKIERTHLGLTPNRKPVDLRESSSKKLRAAVQSVQRTYAALKCRHPKDADVRLQVLGAAAVNKLKKKKGEASVA